MKGKSIKKNVVLNSIKTLMSLVFPLITFPYASRVLSPSGIGKVNFASSNIQYFTMIATLGVTGYGIREASKLRDNRVKLTKFVKEVFLINVISTVISYLLLLVSMFLIPKLSGYRLLLCVSGTVILFTTLGMDWLYSAMEDFYYITVRSIVFQLISIGLLFAFVRTKDDVVKYAAIIAFSNVGSNILNFIHSCKYIEWKQHITFELKRHMRPIFTLFAVAVTSSIYTMLDTTMLGFLTSDWETGIYTAATKVNRLTVSLVTSIGTVFLPRLSYYYGEKSNEKFTELAYKSVSLILLLSAPSIIGLEILSRPVILLLSGKDYLSAVPAMRMMNPIIMIVGLSNFTGVQLFLTVGKEKWTLYSDVLGAVVNFSLNYLLIPRYGALGAALASVCAESSVTISQLVLARPYIRIKPIIKDIIYYFSLSAVMGVAVLFTYRLFSNFLLQLIIPIIVGVFAYGLMLVLTKNDIALSALTGLKLRLGGKSK